MSVIESLEAPVDTPAQAKRLEELFSRCFADCSTSLQGGVDEPLYQPAVVPGQNSVLYYRADYFASALHEIAHWCIAGEARRRQVDFGYWYAPDGRSAGQQRAFESVEYQPQALEWFFSRACGRVFRVSVDNLDQLGGELPDITAFQQRVLQQARQWQRQGLPSRAERFYQVLCREFGTSVAAGDLLLSLAELE